MTKRRNRDYEIGYCRPPVPSQFQPGRSGNPKGRPKKRAATLAEAFTRAFEKPVVVQTSSGRKRTTSLDALAQKMLSDALKGDRHAARLVLQFAEKLRFDLHQANEDGVDHGAVVRAKLEQMRRNIEAAKERGLDT